MSRATCERRPSPRREAGTLTRIALGAAWTLGLAAALLAVDRLIVERPPAGWIPASSVESVPPAAGRVLVPSFLPEYAAWPPAVVLWRAEEGGGWWVGMNARSSEGVPEADLGHGGAILWIGIGLPPPGELGEAAACLDSPPRAGCPSGWHILSGRDPDSRVVHVIGALPAGDLKHVLGRLPGGRSH